MQEGKKWIEKYKEYYYEWLIFRKNEEMRRPQGGLDLRNEKISWGSMLKKAPFLSAVMD